MKNRIPFTKSGSSAAATGVVVFVLCTHDAATAAAAAAAENEIGKDRNLIIFKIPKRNTTKFNEHSTTTVFTLNT